MAPGVMEYVRSPKLPPLVFEAQTCAKDSTYVGVDVVRCRRNGLANAPFPLPILCPADGVEPVDGVLPDLGFVEGCCDARQSCLNLLPYVGPGWYPKVSLAAMLELGVCRWDEAARAPRRTWAWGRRRPTAGCAGTCAAAARKSWTGWWWRRSRSWTWRSGRTWPVNADVKFLLLGDFRQLPAVLDSWAGRPISAPLEHSQLVRDLAGGHRHELTENMRSDPGIFDFVKWLRVGEEACPTLEQAKARLKELFPSKPGWPDTTLVISHSKRMAVNAAANRALAPEGSKLLELEVIHIDLGGCDKCITQNSPQSMRVWPGLRLIGAGGKIPKGVFVAVAEVEPDGVRLDNGMRLKNQELLRATRPSHAVTYASCQGLTLHNRVRLDLESCHLTLRHLYVGASRATSSELLEA